ncbi:translesion error-prone DNA polymerase V autoproteolytic subunit [Flavobacterium sp. D11R37]|uniref:LexA family protein n=1 Tax=Flavobacterium coralii TaxID=2838017 RepID=UPI001CA7714B|nr:translesion error-prone DNA polymerase V autoproteolytic subunit [Flavobacterium coralii]MBY8963679.1 translesion error-prone DNA polymerase V autoproteolytic subunit [Flavobacterium coralii]
MQVKKLHSPGLTFFKPETENTLRLPFVPVGVKAGFPSPALDFMEYTIDLNKYVAKHPHTTFYIKADGHSMRDAGIDDGDILVTDRSLEPANGKIAICLIDGEFTVKRLKLEKGELYLMPENPAYPPLPVTENSQFSVWGIVTFVIKSL